MSSHDSMNVVFKCLSKGAVDFLVKPIRKNELKILWQHVWRKCHSVSCYTFVNLCIKQIIWVNIWTLNFKSPLYICILHVNF
jgi:CheY-like chemotaxis protein